MGFVQGGCLEGVLEWWREDVAVMGNERRIMTYARHNRGIGDSGGMHIKSSEGRGTKIIRVNKS